MCALGGGKSEVWVVVSLRCQTEGYHNHQLGLYLINLLCHWQR